MIIFLIVTSGTIFLLVILAKTESVGVGGD